MDLCFSEDCNQGVNNAKDEDGYTPLHRAAFDNYSVDVVKLLLAHSADVDSSDKNGATVLHWAAIQNSAEVAKLLLAHSADVNSTDILGQTALHRAAYTNSVDVAKVLIENSADVDITNKNGQTALQVAEKEGHQEMVELLKNAST